MSNLHPDNLKDLDNRREPILDVMEHGATTVADYLDDTIADPEGAANRANASSGDAFPAWIYEDYDYSWKTIWGQPNKDKAQHLIPKQSTIEAVLAIHEQGWNVIGKTLDLARAPGNMGTFMLLKNSYTLMIADADKAYQFPIMNTLSNLTRSALAERAFAKYQYLRAVQRYTKPGEEPKDLPEFVENLQSRMMMAATQAGTWLTIHGECWRLADYSNKPTYNNMDYDIRQRLMNNARYLEKEYKRTPQARPDALTHMSLANEC